MTKKQIIDSLRAHVDGDCEICEYKENGGCLRELMMDAAEEIEGVKEVPSRVTTMMKTEFRCGECGERLRAKDVYCWNCGRRVDWEA